MRVGRCSLRLSFRPDDDDLDDYDDDDDDVVVMTPTGVCCSHYSWSQCLKKNHVSRCFIEAPKEAMILHNIVLNGAFNGYAYYSQSEI